MRVKQKLRIISIVYYKRTMSPKKEKKARRREKAFRKKNENVSNEKLFTEKSQDNLEGLFKVPDWLPSRLQKKQRGGNRK